MKLEAYDSHPFPPRGKAPSVPFSYLFPFQAWEEKHKILQFVPLSRSE